MCWACPTSPYPVGSWEFPTVKDITQQPTLTQYCKKKTFLYFRGKDVKPAKSVLYPRNGNDGGIQRGQRPSLAHGLCLQSLVCYTLYLRACKKSGTGILVVGFEADKKSFVSVPVSVTEVKLFD